MVTLRFFRSVSRACLTDLNEQALDTGKAIIDSDRVTFKVNAYHVVTIRVDLTANA